MVFFYKIIWIRKCLFHKSNTYPIFLQINYKFAGHDNTELTFYILMLIYSNYRKLLKHNVISVTHNVKYISSHQYE